MLERDEIWYDNNFMFEELSQLLKDTPKRQSSQAEIGKSVELLRQLEHFQSLNSKYGAEYLVLMLPTLQPFVLREGFCLIQQCDHYMLIQGDLTEQQEKYQASRPVEKGKVLDLNERSGVRFLAESDCKMIRIKRGPSAGFHLEKKLFNFQKQRKKTLQEMQVQLKGQNYKQRYEFLQNITYFNSLGEFDFLELANQSHIANYNQGNVTHKENEPLTKIGCILAGKIRLNYSMATQQVRKGKGMDLFRGEGDWVGLEQFIQRQQHKTSGEASSIVAMVLWIPRDIFQRKFNLKTNYQLISSLKGLIEAKKAIFERSYKCRRNKIMDFQQDIEEAKPVNKQLLDKISNLQLLHQKPRHHFRTNKNCRDIQVPQLIMHRLNFNSNSPNQPPLPKINQKLNFFPQAYKGLPIASAHLKEMQRLQKIINRSLQPKVSTNFIQKNPEKMYQTILQKIPRKYKPSPSQFLKTTREQKPVIHYNMSIYNNFRVGKQRVLSPTFSNFKTLDVIGNNKI